MLTREPDPSIGTAAKNVAERASSIVRLEIELAALELKRKASALGIGAGLGVAAALLLLYVIGFALASIAAGLATAMPMWAALLIVAAVLLLGVAILGVLAMQKIEKGTPPVPEQAIEEARLTTEALRGNGSGH